VDAGHHPASVFTPAPAPGSSLPPAAPAAASSSSESNLLQRVSMLVRAYQVRGHERAKLDPLGLWDPHSLGE
jgi:2-oxoglutarate dehydrogenase complex dehydrogenase (E1) component-like enzyme